MTSPQPESDAPGSDVDELPQLVSRSYSVCVLCIVTASVFFLTGVAPLPVLLYFPLSRRFSFQPSGIELSMDFYGRSLLALLAGLAAALSAYVLLELRRKKSAPHADLPKAQANATAKANAKTAETNKTLPLLTGYAATALVLAAGLYAYQLWVRVPTPLPLPSPPDSQSITAE
jgi:hypothetical protein